MVKGVDAPFCVVQQKQSRVQKNPRRCVLHTQEGGRDMNEMVSKWSVSKRSMFVFWGMCESGLKTLFFISGN